MEHHGCRHLLNSLSGYIDHDLSLELCDEIERHLAGCENCRIVIDTLRRTVELYHDNNTPAALAEDVRQRLYMRLELEDYLKSE